MDEREEPDMITHVKRLMATLLAFALLLGPVPAARAATPPGESEGVGSTPPRLSYTTGEVSFWRPGATDWAPAQINTPLAAGDELYTATQGTLELQVGARAFVRAWATHSLDWRTRSRTSPWKWTRHTPPSSSSTPGTTARTSLTSEPHS